MFRIRHIFRAVCFSLAAAGAAKTAAPLRAADVKVLLLSKTVLYQQNDGGAPAQLTSSGYEFRVRLELTRTQAVSSATVKLPVSGTTRSLTNYVSFWELSERFNISGALNLAYQNGVFLVNLIGGDGRHTNSLTLFADTYPSPIHVANFDDAQRLDPAADFTLKWDPPGLAASDFLQVRVLRDGVPVFESVPVPGAAGALNGTATSILIPKKTFEPGAVYQAEITALRRASADTAGYPGVTAWAAYARRTQFPLRTVFSTTDVPVFGIAKIRRFQQSSAAAPAASAAGNAFSFYAFASPASGGALSSASVKAPSGQQKSLAPVSGFWSWMDDFASQQSLDGSYAAGGYQLAMQTAHNGLQAITLTLPAPAFPAPPQISNWVEANSIDPARPFVLSWSSLGGSANDFVKVTVFKNDQPVFQSGSVIGAGDSLSGSATSVSLPAGLLAAGETAEASIEFIKFGPPDIYSYPGGRGMTGFGSETKAVLRARGGSVSAPVISAPRPGNGFMDFTITGNQGRLYAIQSCSTLGSWADLLFTNAPGSSFTVRLGIDSRQTAVIIRAVVY